MYRLIFIFVIFLMAFSSCEKVIDVDLNDANPRIVIEGNIHNGEGPFSIKVSQTGSYFDEYSVKMISGAVVQLSDDMGQIIQFIEVEDGQYEAVRFKPEVDQLYKLSVTYSGITYEAESYMSSPAIINNIYTKYDEGTTFIPAGYKLTCIFHDQAGIDNYYRVKVYINNNLMNGADDYFIFADQLFDGNNIEFQLRRSLFKKGDSIRVDLMSIDKNAFEYFSTLEDIIGEGIDQSAAPSNPKSNFTNGALGYFSAYSFDSQEIVVK